MQTLELRSSTDAESGDDAVAKGEAWIDIEVADEDGRRWLASESGLDDEIIRRLVEPASATCWRRFGQGFHLNMRATVPGEDTSKIEIVVFGIWLEPGRIITVRHSKVSALDRVVEFCSAGEGPASSWELLVFMLSTGRSRVEENLHKLTAVIDQLEDEVMTGSDRPPIDQVAELQKQLVYLRRTHMPLESMLTFITAQTISVIDDALRYELEEIGNAFTQNQKLLGFLTERASALQVQIRDQMADSMNAATYRFTWVATVFLPLGFLTGLLGINVAGIPGNHNPLAFWLVCGALCVIAVAWGIAVGRFRR